MANPATGYSPLDMFGPLAELFQGSLPASPTQGDDPEAFLGAPGQTPVTSPTTPPPAAPPPGTSPTDALRMMVMGQILKRLQEPAPEWTMGQFWKKGLGGLRADQANYDTRQSGANTMVGLLNSLNRSENDDELNWWRRDASERGWAGLEMQKTRAALSAARLKLAEAGLDDFTKEEINPATGVEEIALYGVRRDPTDPTGGKMQVVSKQFVGRSAYSLTPPTEIVTPEGPRTVQLPTKPTTNKPFPIAGEIGQAPQVPTAGKVQAPAAAPPPTSPVVPQQQESQATSDKPPAPEEKIPQNSTPTTAAPNAKVSTNKSATEPKKPKPVITTDEQKILDEYFGTEKTSRASPHPNAGIMGVLPPGARILNFLKQPPVSTAAQYAQQQAFLKGLGNDILEMHKMAYDENADSMLGLVGRTPGRMFNNWMAGGSYSRAMVGDRQVAFDQAISWLVYQYVKAQTGAQFSYNEFLTYQKQFPNSIDTPERAKMLIGGAVTAARRYSAQLKLQYPQLGGNSPQYSPADDMMPPEVEEALKILSEE